MQPAPETILVASANSALAVTGNIFNASTGAVNLTNGQLGLISAKHGQTVAYGDFVAAGETVADARYVRLVQGTPGSANVSTHGGNPGNDLPYVASQVIDGKKPIQFAGAVATTPSYSAWVIGDVAANNGSITAVDETEYLMHIGFTGVRNNREFAISGIETLPISYTTPNYTTLGTTNGVDHLLKNVAHKVNLNSNTLGLVRPGGRSGTRNVIALAVNIAGGAGTGTGNSVTTAGSQSTAVVDLQSGSGNPVTTIPVEYDGTNTFSIAVDATMNETFDNLVANSVLTAASTVEIINLATAGAALKADAIVLIATDKETAIVTDTETAVKVRLHVGLEYNFNSLQPLLVEASDAYEGIGKGRDWKIRSDSYYQLNQYTNQTNPRFESFIQPPSYVDPTKEYNVFIFTNIRPNVVNYSHTAHNSSKTILLVESVAGVGLSNTVTSLNAVVQPWLASAEIENVEKAGANYFA